MDQNCEDILEALQRHSERNNHFIEQLKKLKPQSIPMQLWNSFRSKLPKVGSKLDEASSNYDSPQSDQTEKVNFDDDIQDIRIKIQNLEKETEEVVKKLSLYECTVSEKGEKESKAIHVQVYERDMHTADFVTALKNRLPKRCLPDVIENVSDIDINKPLIILCQSGSRLLPDITYSLEYIGDLNSLTRLAIVIIHHKQGHALPVSSKTRLSNDEKFKNIWIIDVVYTKALKFYDCKMNNEAIATIEKFLKSDTPI